MSGHNVDDALTYNPKCPQASYIAFIGDDKMVLDGPKLRDAAEALGAQPGDVLSVGGYRNASGTLIPMYDTVRIERRADDND